MKERGRRRIDAVLGVVGRTFITTGLLLLGLVVYQLWGTGFEQRRAQDRLRDDFTELITVAGSRPTTPSTTLADADQTPEPIEVPRRPNSALALLEVPSAGIADIVVEGASVSALRHGPGHITGTALPGEAGNSAIAGHRTTYGAPFADLDEVKIGDEVRVTTTRGIFVYEIDDVRIVAPNRTDVLRAREGSTRLTLITCHPRFSTAKRLIVTAELASTEPLATTQAAPSTDATSTSTTIVEPTVTEPTVVEAVDSPAATPDLDELDGWFSDSGAIFPAILVGLALVAISLATHFGRKALRSRGLGAAKSLYVSWGVAAVPFCVTLFYWYHFINMLLPAST
jgi:sortase A